MVFGYYVDFVIDCYNLELMDYIAGDIIGCNVDFLPCCKSPVINVYVECDGISMASGTIYISFILSSGPGDESLEVDGYDWSWLVGNHG